MAEYTKGEWRARKSDTSELWHITADGKYICCCPPEYEANAHLIAAAPDMHEALRDALGAIRQDGEIDYRQIEQALAKADIK